MSHITTRPYKQNSRISWILSSLTWTSRKDRVRKKLEEQNHCYQPWEWVRKEAIQDFKKLLHFPQNVMCKLSSRWADSLKIMNSDFEVLLFEYSTLQRWINFSPVLIYFWSRRICSLDLDLILDLIIWVFIIVPQFIL